MKKGAQHGALVLADRAANLTETSTTPKSGMVAPEEARRPDAVATPVNLARFCGSRDSFGSLFGLRQRRDALLHARIQLLIALRRAFGLQPARVMRRTALIGTRLGFCSHHARGDHQAEYDEDQAQSLEPAKRVVTY
jgi:hypothetical protein